MNWQTLGLIAAIQQELDSQNSGNYERLQIFEDVPYWTLSVEKEPMIVPLTGSMTPGYAPSFEVDRVRLERKGWFCRKQVSNTNDGGYVYWMNFGISHKCKTAIYYLFDPELWEIVRRDE